MIKQATRHVLPEQRMVQDVPSWYKICLHGTRRVFLGTRISSLVQDMSFLNKDFLTLYKTCPPWYKTCPPWYKMCPPWYKTSPPWYKTCPLWYNDALPGTRSLSLVQYISSLVQDVPSLVQDVWYKTYPPCKKALCLQGRIQGVGGCPGGQVYPDILNS